jgi:mannose-1-phosphate guanylyltransferase
VNELTRQRPDILAAAEAAVSGRFGLWRRLKPISVDYAVLEGAREIRAVKLHCGWDDLGSWDVAARLAPKPKRRLAILVDAPGSAVFARDRLIAVLGVPDVVVVDAPGAVLVVARSRAQEVRRVVAALATHGRKDLE